MTLAIVAPGRNWKSSLEVVGVKSDFVSTLKVGPIGCVVLNKERKSWKDKVTIYEKRKPLCVVGYGQEVGRWSWGVWGNYKLLLDILNMRCLLAFQMKLQAGR